MVVICQDELSASEQQAPPANYQPQQPNDMRRPVDHPVDIQVPVMPLYAQGTERCMVLNGSDSHERNCRSVLTMNM